MVPLIPERFLGPLKTFFQVPERPLNVSPGSRTFIRVPERLLGSLSVSPGANLPVQDALLSEEISRYETLQTTSGTRSMKHTRAS